MSGEAEHLAIYPWWVIITELCGICQLKDAETHLIATSHIQELLELKQLPKESASDSAELVNAVWISVNALEALNINFKTHHIEDILHHMQSVATQAKLLSSPSPKGFHFSPRREEMSPRKC